MVTVNTFDFTEIKKEADKLMAIPGDQKGAILLSHLAIVKKRSGDEALKILEKTMADLGYPVKFDEVKSVQLYPEAQTIMAMWLCQVLFGYTNQVLFDIGVEATKLSLITKLMMRTFLNLDKVIRKIPEYWNEHLSVGRLECYEYEPEKKYLILRLHDYKFHPSVCWSMAGYFIGFFKYLRTNAVIKETKCPHKGDPFHEFFITWQ
jgi:hypothetical protein